MEPASRTRATPSTTTAQVPSSTLPVDSDDARERPEIVQIRGGRFLDGRRTLREDDHVRDLVGGDALDQRHGLRAADLVGYRRTWEQDAAAQRQQRERGTVVGNGLSGHGGASPFGRDGPV